MPVTTGSGDDGSTGLWTGERVSKGSLRVEAYGTVDELSAFIGDARHRACCRRVKDALKSLQRDLFKVAGELASPGREYADPLDESDIARIASLTAEIESALDLGGFVVPGNTPASARLDVCRTVARRAERCVVRLREKEPVRDAVAVYLNRLSDLLFVLARYEEHRLGKIEYK